MTLPDVRQTKFILAAFLVLVATLLVMASFVQQVLGHDPFVTFSAWWQVGLYILGTYAVADITSTHLQQSKAIPPQDQTA